MWLITVITMVITKQLLLLVITVTTIVCIGSKKRVDISRLSLFAINFAI